MFPEGVLVSLPRVSDFKDFTITIIRWTSLPPLWGKKFFFYSLFGANKSLAFYFLTFQITCSPNLQNIGAKQPNWCSAKKVIESVMDLKQLSFEKPRASQKASLPCSLGNLIQYLLFFYNLAAKHQITNMFDYFRLLFPQAWCLCLCIYALQGSRVHWAKGKQMWRQEGLWNRPPSVSCHSELVL